MRLQQQQLVCGVEINNEPIKRTLFFCTHTHTSIYNNIMLLLLYSLKFFLPSAFYIRRRPRGVNRCEHRLHAVSVYNTIVATHSGRTRKSPGLLCSSVCIQSKYIFKKKWNKNAVRKRNKQNIIYKYIYIQ